MTDIEEMLDNLIYHDNSYNEDLMAAQAIREYVATLTARLVAAESRVKELEAEKVDLENQWTYLREVKEIYWDHMDTFEQECAQKEVDAMVPLPEHAPEQKEGE